MSIITAKINASFLVEGLIADHKYDKKKTAKELTAIERSLSDPYATH